MQVMVVVEVPRREVDAIGGLEQRLQVRAERFAQHEEFVAHPLLI